MVRTAGLFAQLLSLFPRAEFQAAVRHHGAERYAKGFSSWDQFVAMLFCQLAQAHSLREICSGLRCCIGKLQHLGIQADPKRSTLSYANEHRPWQLFEGVFQQLLAKCREVAPRRCKFRFKNKLLSLDSTSIELSLSLFEWAKFRTKKGAVKLHMLLDHDGYLPTYAVVTEGRSSDIAVARGLQLAPGSILVVDRGYIDYAWLTRLSRNGVFFVTRLMANADIRVLERRPVRRSGAVLSDRLIRLNGKKYRETCDATWRVVSYRDPETGKKLRFLTNHLTLAAQTVADIYRDRWQIELFFKALKQNLRIKTFVGTSFNALMTQIWTALISILLLKYLQFRSKLNWALSNLVALLRWNLFTYRDLWRWIDDPFGNPPLLPNPVQYAFRFD